jgi:hypothetical protein
MVLQKGILLESLKNDTLFEEDLMRLEYKGKCSYK